MKKLYILICVLFSCMACVDDNSKIGTDLIPDIEISELRDTAIVSYNGNILQLTPELKTGYSEDELSFAWYIYNTDGNTTEGEMIMEGFRTEKIGEDKTLSYEVNLPSGSYKIIFEAMAPQYGYSRTASMTLSTSTAFSKGFYILKEMNGQTELDLATEEGLNENLMERMLGAPLKGKPVNMSVTYKQCYIDENTQLMTNTKMLNIITEKDYRALRTEDLKQIHDRSTIFFDDQHQDEEFYAVYHAMWYIFLFTDKGYYGCRAGGDVFQGDNAGKFGFPVGTGSSKFAQQLDAGNAGVAYWNENERALWWADYQASEAIPVDCKLPASMDLSTVECIGTGINFVAYKETVWFLVADEKGHRCLLLMEGGTDKVTRILEINAQSRFAQAKILAGNALSANIIYFVSDNKLWAYGWNDGNEYEIPLPGVQGTIGYITNAFLNLSSMSGGNGENFDALIVATENAGNYNLYIFDDLVGGAPQSAVEPYQGTGTVNSVRYVPSLWPDVGGVWKSVGIPWTD